MNVVTMMIQVITMAINSLQERTVSSLSELSEANDVEQSLFEFINELEQINSKPGTLAFKEYPRVHLEWLDAVDVLNRVKFAWDGHKEVYRLFEKFIEIRSEVYGLPRLKEHFQYPWIILCAFNENMHEFLSKAAKDANGDVKITHDPNVHYYGGECECSTCETLRYY